MKNFTQSQLLKHFCIVFQYVHALIKEVTALVPVFRDSLYTMAVYTAERTRQRCPILLATLSQQDFNTWVK